MKHLLAVITALSMQSAWADMTLTLVDDQQRPVANAVISLPTYPQATPDSVAVMNQTFLQFSPEVLVIQKGQKVSFPNNDDVRHHVYSFSQAKSFELKLYKDIVAAPITFNKPGLVVLGCNIHDDMIGYIYVSDNVFAIKTDDQGRATIPAKKGDRLNIWQENLYADVDAQKTLVLESETDQTIVLNQLDQLNSF